MMKSNCAATNFRDTQEEREIKAAQNITEKVIKPETSANLISVTKPCFEGG